MRFICYFIFGSFVNLVESGWVSCLVLFFQIELQNTKFFFFYLYLDLLRRFWATTATIGQDIVVVPRQNRSNTLYFLNKINLLLRFWLETAAISWPIDAVKNRSNRSITYYGALNGYAIKTVAVCHLMTAAISIYSTSATYCK